MLLVRSDIINMHNILSKYVVVDVFPTNGVNILERHLCLNTLNKSEKSSVVY